MGDDESQKAPDFQSRGNECAAGGELPTATFSAAPPLITHFGSFEALEKLGEGGMGVVYKARDARLDRIVALKLVARTQTGDSQAQARLLREARVAARLDHPNICTIYSVEQTADSYCVAMQFVQGKTLQQMIAQGPLTFERFLEIIPQVASGLEAAHQHNVVHRDIKSSNIMVTDSGQVKILDFGLSHLISGATASHMLTASGVMSGTLAYMAPEQLRGERGDPLSDIFSLGVVMYETLTGKLPFARPTPAEVMIAILSEEPERLEVLRPEVPDAIAKIISKALSKDRPRRYQSATELLDDFIMVSPASALGWGRTRLPAPPANRLRLSRRSALLVSLGVIGLFGGALWWRAHWQGSARLRPGPPVSSNQSRASLVAAGSMNSKVAAQPSLAVLPFSNLSKDPKFANLETGVEDALTQSLVESGRFRTVERSQLDRVMNELNLNRSEYVDPATAQKIGRLIGAQYLVVGSFQVWQGQIRLNARLIRVETGEVVGAEKVMGPVAETLKLPDQLALKFLHALPPDVTGAKP
jgi:serine/threonine-protein kinase